MSKLALSQGVLVLNIEIHRKKSIQKLLAQILEICIALSNGPLPNLFKMVLSQGILGLQVEYT